MQFKFFNLDLGSGSKIFVRIHMFKRWCSSISRTCWSRHVWGNTWFFLFVIVNLPFGEWFTRIFLGAILNYCVIVKSNEHREFLLPPNSKPVHLSISLNYDIVISFAAILICFKLMTLKIYFYDYYCYTNFRIKT